ncbi:MAG: hypothetical protein AABZ47_06160 [Planctomycetota bacterium]
MKATFLTLAAIFQTATPLLADPFVMYDHEPMSMLRAIREQDQAILSNSSIEVRVEQPTRGWELDQGYRMELCTMNFTLDRQASMCDTISIPELRYRPLNDRVHARWDYDDQGYFVVWVPMSSGTLHDTERNDSVTELASFGLNDQSKVVWRGNSTTYDRYSASDHNNWTTQEPLIYLRALGRNFSSILEGDLEVESLDSPIRSLCVNGFWGNLSGQWAISVESEPPYLVRHAAFTRTGRAQPILEFQSKGTLWFGNFAFANEGSYTVHLSDQNKVVHEIALEDFIPQVNPTLFEEVESTLREVEGRKHKLQDRRNKPARAGAN